MSKGRKKAPAFEGRPFAASPEHPKARKKTTRRSKKLAPGTPKDPDLPSASEKKILVAERLTERQRAYVYYRVEFNMGPTAAARNAGYAIPNSASDILEKNTKVQYALAIARAEYAIASQMTKGKVMDGFLEAIQQARVQADPMAMIAGFREIGKLCGFYEPSRAKLEISVTGQQAIERMQEMGDAELLAIAQDSPDVLDGQFEEVAAAAKEAVNG